MSYSKEQLQAMVEAVPYWWHSINLGQGVVTPGHKSPEYLAQELAALHLPDLRGKTVLDIGAFDGFYSFEAERRGAARVVALEHDSWLAEVGYTPEYQAECRRRGVPLKPARNPRDLVRIARPPQEQAGKRGFNTAHQALGSRVESVLADFMTTDLDQLGTFDVVLFLGVLYHLENPLGAVKRLARVTREVAVIETEAVLLLGQEHRSVCWFLEGDELNDDPSNWWAPNQKALTGLCRSAGFRRVDVCAGPETRVGPEGVQLWDEAPRPFGTRLSFALWYLLNGDGPTRELGLTPAVGVKLADLPQLQMVRYRAVVHAWK
jgi:tRNA (mo5U34)-methyltransferase